MHSSALALAREHQTPPDLGEFYVINRFDDPEVARRAGLREGREVFFLPNLWPDPGLVPDFRESFLGYYKVMEDLATALMGLMALALGLDEHWFEDKIVDHITGMSAACYPALEAAPLPGQYRRGAAFRLGKPHDPARRRRAGACRSCRRRANGRMCPRWRARSWSTSAT